MCVKMRWTYVEVTFDVLLASSISVWLMLPLDYFIALNWSHPDYNLSTARLIVLSLSFHSDYILAGDLVFRWCGYFLWMFSGRLALALSPVSLSRGFIFVGVDIFWWMFLGRLALAISPVSLLRTLSTACLIVLSSPCHFIPLD
ncbi:hypothetical protein K435DRAFT_228183 [Dendrothele bispora CBS 962.96]|uniref:Uncharacterized protein n=1 Tax=Dendrothele bispora (strain CBS 962.96) TaxID=1314807 RepID=A0A4S8LQX2_DENBC|nr:hypothetical protein K435DRAFT_228183 [Dendrothele bispora CBS 962.96]